MYKVVIMLEIKTEHDTLVTSPPPPHPTLPCREDTPSAPVKSNTFYLDSKLTTKTLIRKFIFKDWYPNGGSKLIFAWNIFHRWHIQCVLSSSTTNESRQYLSWMKIIQSSFFSVCHTIAKITKNLINLPYHWQIHYSWPWQSLQISMLHFINPNPQKFRNLKTWLISLVCRYVFKK